MIGFLIRLLCAAAACWAAFVIGSAAWKGESLALEKIPDQNFTPEISRLMAEGRFKEAEQLCCNVIGMGLPGSGSANILLRRCREERRSWRVNAVDSFKGFVTGHGRNSAALAGAAASDLFLYGDLRDLGIQLYRKVVGLPVDTVITTLSAAGVAAELTFANSLPALVKMLHRMGGISASLMDHCRSALLNLRKRGRVSAAEKELFSNLELLFRRQGIHRSKTILRAIRDPEELKAALQVGKNFPEVPFFITRSSPRQGGGLLLRFSKSPETLQMLRVAARKGIRGTLVLEKIRIVKFSLKNILQGRFYDIMVYEGAENPRVRRWLWGAVLFCSAAALFLGLSLVFSVGKILRKMKARRSEAEDVLRSSPEDNAPDSSNSGCSDPDQRPGASSP